MLLLYNGKIYCGDSFQEALLIDGEIIKEIGSSSYLLNKYPDVKTIDLDKKLVVPGFNDAHMHLLGYAENKRNLKLFNVKSISDVIKLGKNYLKDNQDIILARGYNDELFKEKRLLTKNDLDQISSSIPIIATRVCTHVVSVNSKVIELCKIENTTKIEGGSIDLDKDNNVLGVLRENAISLIDSLFIDKSIDRIKELILDGLKDASSNGITSISTNDINGNLEYSVKILEAYLELYNENKLNVRINHQITFTNLNKLNKFLENKINNPYLRVGPLKLFIDGSLGAKTAYLSNNYLNDNQNGILCISESELEEILQFSKKHDLQVVIHAIGDQAIKVCLNGFSKIIDSQNSLRHGIIHV